MQTLTLSPIRSLKGELTIPSDKSISHRALMFACLAEGKSRIKNLLYSADPLSTMSCMKALGVEIKEVDRELIVHGKGLRLAEATDVLDAGNSGTTVRLLSGILAGQDFASFLTGDQSLRQRPMARVIEPLQMMGAKITARANNRYLPMSIKGGSLKPIDYTMPMASAQVKSCLILASLYSEGISTITEPAHSRDHTERMLKAMGAQLDVQGLTVKVSGTKNLHPIDIEVPGDFSSASFFIVASLIAKDSELLVKNVCINPTRTGLLDVIKQMGAEVKLINQRTVSGEPVADLLCSQAKSLKAVKISGQLIPRLIDEFPIICILASCAEGVTQIRDAEELRHKETDRIAAMASNLTKLGITCTEYPDGIDIVGRGYFSPAVVNSFDDHRIAMSMAVASVAVKGEITIENPHCVDISFPGFYEMFGSIATAI